MRSMSCLCGVEVMIAFTVTTNLMGTAVALERLTQSAAAQTAQEIDVTVRAAEENVRRADEKMQSKQRAGGEELRQAQQELIRARENLTAARAVTSNRRDQDDRQRNLEQAKQDKLREEARQAESTRQFREMERQRAEGERLSKERKQAEREQGQEEILARMNRLDEAHRQREAVERAEGSRLAEIARREQAKPQNILTRLYASYIQIKRCYEGRAGKAFVYIDDRQYAAARDQTKDVESKLLRIDAGIDRDAAWRAANERDPTTLLLSGDGMDDVEAGVLSDSGQELCRGALAAVKEQFLAFNPEAAVMKKDF